MSKWGQGKEPKRITGRALTAIRAEHFQRFPLCVHCKAKGRLTVAVQLDHIVALINGGIDSHDPFENRQGLCKPCHDDKTNEDMGRKPRPQIGADGYPEDE